MIKYLFVAINSIALFFYGILFENGPVTVKGNFPANIKPGTEITAELIVNKGSMGGFAKLQIEVPEGIIVKEADSKGATFSFATGVGKWIWTGVPSDAEFTVKFVLAADAAASGVKLISSKYSYIDNNNKQVVEMTPVEITIGEAGAVAATSNTATPETKTEVPVAAAPTPTETPATPTPTETPAVPTPTEAPVVAVAKTPEPVPAAVSADEPNSLVTAKRLIMKGNNDNEWSIHVKIKKDGIKGFARYSDNLPEGFTAKADMTNGSSFSVADNRIKFVWVNVPESEELEISYVLSGTIKTEVTLEGEFSYLESNQSKFYKLPFEKLPVFESTTTPVTTVTTPTETPVTTVTTPTETPVTTVTTPTETPVTTVTTPTETPVTAVTTPTEAPVTTVTTPTETAKTSNVSYCVQIGAYTNANVTTSRLASIYKINESIRSEMSGGFTKFLIGKHNEYKSARDHREMAKGKGVNGAFVTAYNGPTRITVQEALMISNQKWYR